MSVVRFLKSAGWTAIAVAFVASVAPAEASAQGRTRADRASQERDGGSRADAGRQRNAAEVRGQRARLVARGGGDSAARRGQHL